MKIETASISGLWKFKDTTLKEELEAIAEELAKDDHYIKVYIRRVSKEKNGTGITYVTDTIIGEKKLMNISRR